MRNPSADDGDARITEALQAIRQACGVLSEHITSRQTRLISREEVARRLGVPVSWVKREQQAGRLPFAHKLAPESRKWVYNEAELERYVVTLGTRS
jgi:hypothetical protein